MKEDNNIQYKLKDYYENLYANNLDNLEEMENSWKHTIFQD